MIRNLLSGRKPNTFVLLCMLNETSQSSNSSRSSDCTTMKPETHHCSDHEQGRGKKTVLDALLGLPATPSRYSSSNVSIFTANWAAIRSLLTKHKESERTRGKVVCCYEAVVAGKLRVKPRSVATSKSGRQIDGLGSHCSPKRKARSKAHHRIPLGP